MKEFIQMRTLKHGLFIIRQNLFKKTFLSGIIFFLILLFIFLVNGVHESYPDEFDNILGGWNILHGNPLYSKFFTHHGPTAYFLAAFVEIFSGNSFVRFRIIYSILLLAFFGFSFWYYRKTLGINAARFFPLFLVFFGVSATYFWGHMLLADNIAGIFLSLVIGLLLIKHLNHRVLSRPDLMFISILTFLSILSSLTYLYLVIILYAFVFFEYFSSNQISFKKAKNYIFPILTFAIPFLIFILYLLLTRSFNDYLYQNITFNQKYYIYNYPRAPGETFINPIRFAIVIAHSFLLNFFDLLIQIKDFNFNFPFNISLAVGNLSLMIYMYIRKKNKLLVFFLLMLIYSNGRSNPLTSGERDYQSAVYIMISILALCYLIYELYDKLRTELEYRKRLIYSLLLVITFIYAFANFSFLGKRFVDKAYQKYMGNAPLIYNRPQIAPILNNVLTQNDFTWIGPFEFEELFYTKIKNTSQYQIFNPGMGKSEKIHEGLISDFDKNKPKLIWFDKKFHILGLSPEQYGEKFISYLDSRYYTLLDYRKGDSKFVSVKPIDQRTDIETKFYIRKENVDEIIGKLLEMGIIREVKAQ